MTPTGRLLLLLSLFLVVVSGCNTSATPARVSGAITYKGEPVPAGSITFQADQGGVFTYAISADGMYTGTDLPAGDMIVTIETESVNPQAAAGRPKATMPGAGGKKEGANPNDYMEKMKAMGKMPDSPAVGKYVKIPAKYADKAKSGLKVTLKAGSNVNDFPLTD
jgi:hypothetical protein